MGNIDDFKANLIGGGARVNQFRITITPPPGIAIGLDVRRTSFLVTATAIPSIEMNFFEVPFRGRVLQYPGDRPAPPIGQQHSTMIQTLWLKLLWKDGVMV